MPGHNHKPWCTCGWCVKYTHTSYIPKREVKTTVRVIKKSYNWDYSHIKKIETYKSFVNPNAKCPVCKTLVFFYQSPYGGKVFFDVLGPPWTKHPCTDNSYEKAPLSIHNDKGKFNYRFSWMNIGWNPYIVKDIERINNKIFSFDTEENTYISIQNHYNITRGSILHIKSIDDFFYEASILDGNNISVLVILFLKKDFYDFTISIQILTNIFFKAYREQNKVLMKKIINTKKIKDKKLDKVFKFIYEKDINIFFRILRDISLYSPKILIDILKSTDDIYVKRIANDIY